MGGVGWMRRLGPTAAHVTKGDAAHATDPRIVRIHHGRNELANSDATRGRPGPMKGRRDHDVDVDVDVDGDVDGDGDGDLAELEGKWKVPG